MEGAHRQRQLVNPFQGLTFFERAPIFGHLFFNDFLQCLPVDEVHHQVEAGRNRQQLRAVFGANGFAPIQTADRADVPGAVFLIEISRRNVGMAQRRQIERLALEQVERRRAFVGGGGGIVQNVHLFAGQHVANGAIEHAVNRAKITAAQTLDHIVTVFDAVANAMLQKPDFGRESR